MGPRGHRGAGPKYALRGSQDRPMAATDSTLEDTRDDVLRPRAGRSTAAPSTAFARPRDRPEETSRTGRSKAPAAAPEGAPRKLSKVPTMTLDDHLRGLPRGPARSSAAASAGGFVTPRRGPRRPPPRPPRRGSQPMVRQAPKPPRGEMCERPRRPLEGLLHNPSKRSLRTVSTSSGTTPPKVSQNRLDELPNNPPKGLPEPSQRAPVRGSARALAHLRRGVFEGCRGVSWDPRSGRGGERWDGL
jgi:hypothetical protein